MSTQDKSHVVTGAFGFSGKYIARKLLDGGEHVRTITNSVNRKNPFGQRIQAYPFNFDNIDKLAAVLEGADVLYNTYWIRFNHKLFSHNLAVENTLKLFQAAKRAKVKRIVHVSITNPCENSRLEYFRGKAMLEKALLETGIPCSILRPAVIFGKEDILINNITWVLRKLPVFPVFGYGSYRLQPIFVEDFAELAVQEGHNNGNRMINAIGPETYTYRTLIEKIGDIIGVHKPIISVSPLVGYILGFLVSKIVKDVVITREEIMGLMADLLCVDAASTVRTRLSLWVEQNKESLGRKYVNELARRRDRQLAYEG